MMHRAGNGEELVRIDRKKLLTTLKSNRKKHVEEYAIAIKQYRADVIEEMEKLVETMKDGAEVRTAIREHVRAPSSHEADYDAAIDRYTWSVDKNVILDTDQFDKYVRNVWSWSHGLSNAMYFSKATEIAMSSHRS